MPVHARRRAAAPILAAAILTAWGAVSAAPGVPDSRTLPNGLRVTLLEDHTLPVVSVSLWVGAGSKDESEASAGYAHFLEHLIQRGTERVGPHEYTRRAHRWGGSVGVRANYDRTSITLTGLPSVLDEMLGAAADMAFHASLKDGEVDLERGTLYQEIRTYYDRPASVAFLEAMRAAYSGHPYHVPMLGSFQTLGSLRSEPARAFYQNLYVPNNMALALAGDFDPKIATARIEAAFGAVPKSATLPGRPGPPAKFAGHTDVEKRLDFDENWTTLTFVGPGYRHPDRAAFEVLAASLADPGSPIAASLTQEKAGALSQVSYHLLEDAGLLYIALTPFTADLSYQAAAVALKPIVALKRNGPDEAVVTGQIARLLLEERLREAPMTERAEGLGEAALFGGLRYYWDRPLALGRVTAADVARVARTYLVAENLRLVVLVPKATPPIPDAGKTAFHAVFDTLGEAGEGTAPGLTAVAFPPSEAARATPSAWGNPKGAAIPAQVSRTVLGNGLTLLVLEDHRQPVAAASLHIEVGSGDDPEGRAGLASMALRLIATRAAARAQETKSAAPRSMLFIPEAMATRDALEIRFGGPASDLTPGLAALAWSLQQPLPGTAPTLETVRRSCLASLQRGERDADTIGIDLFREKVYAGDAYAARSEGTTAGLAAVTEGDVKEFGTRALRPDRVVLAIVGDVEAKPLAREVERILGGWAAPSTATPSPKDASAPSAPASATSGSRAGQFTRLSSSAQSHVVAGVPASPLLDQDFPGLRQVGGVVTLLTFEELVFARRAAFSVVTFPEGLRRGGSLAFEVVASHGRRDDALFELQRVMRRLATEDLREEDRRDAARMIAGSSAIGAQRALPLASTLAYREAAGLGAGSWRDEFTPAPLSSERLKALAEQYFKPASWISVVVGPPQQ